MPWFSMMFARFEAFWNSKSGALPVRQLPFSGRGEPNGLYIDYTGIREYAGTRFDVGTISGFCKDYLTTIYGFERVYTGYIAESTINLSRLPTERTSLQKQCTGLPSV